MKLMQNIKLMAQMLVGICALVLIFIITARTNSSLLWPKAESEILPWEGTGSSADPFLIYNLSDLISMREAVREGNSFEGYCFRQVCDIDLGEDSLWIPIGEYGSGHYFYGTYDGASHSISNLNFSPEGEISSNNGGFFGMLGGRVMNLGIESGCIQGDYVGSIASHSVGSRASIINCYNKAEVIGNGRAGGICDNFSGGSIINCINYGAVSAPQSAQIVSYDANYVINVLPIDNAVSAGFQGTFLNYVVSDENTSEDFLNEGIRYLDAIELLPDVKLSYWNR